MDDSAQAELNRLLAAVLPVDQQAADRARTRQANLTKPVGALGVLEEVSIRLAALSGRCPAPIPERAVVAVFAADHGVHAQGVTAWPQEVTAQMVANFLAGGAAVNVLAAQVGAQVVVVDVGVATELAAAPGLLTRRVRPGTADLSQEPAMTRTQARQALLAGAQLAADLVADGAQVLLTGDMGIANTTASAALIAAFTGASPEAVTGRGTGVDQVTWNRKVEVVTAGLTRHGGVVANRASDPLAVLAALGGLEHAALAGFVLSAAAQRVPVILDGVIAGAAALVAHALAPLAVEACLAGHRSTEPGHRVALDHLGLRPLIDLDLRLGEGTGALLALPIVQASARVLRDMATFDDAGVSR